MKAKGGRLIATICPLCQFNLDQGQTRDSGHPPLPVLFFTQLMGLAMEIDRAQLGLEKLVVRPFDLLAQTVDAPPGAEEKPRKRKAAKLKAWGEA